MKKNSLARELRHRRGLIESADATVVECRRLTSTPIDAGATAARHWRRAAKLSVAAAGSYQQAGLGLLAIEAWSAAAACYESLGLEKERTRCETSATAVPRSYDEG